VKTGQKGEKEILLHRVQGFGLNIVCFFTVGKVKEEGVEAVWEEKRVEKGGEQLTSQIGGGG